MSPTIPPASADLDAFWDASKELDAAYLLLARSCGLSEPEYWSLVFLHEGAETQREIRERLSLSRQTMSSAFKVLVGKGLVRLEPMARDQRSKRASLTEAGKALVAGPIARAAEGEVRAWNSLPAEGREALIRLTRQFSAALLGELRAGGQSNPGSSEDL